MIGSLFNILAGRSDFSSSGHKISAAPGQQAIDLQMQRAQRANLAGSYGLAANARGANQGLAIREAQRRAQLGNAQIADSGAQASLQLQQGVAEANQRAAMQADQINAGISQSNAGGLAKVAGGVVGGAALALSDAEAKMPLRPAPARAEIRPITMLPPVASHYTYAPIDGSGLSVGQQERNIAVESAARDRTAAYLGRTESPTGAPGELSAPRVNYVVSDPSRMQAVGERAFALAPGESMHVDPAMYERPVSMQEAAYQPGPVGPTEYSTPGVSTTLTRSAPQSAPPVSTADVPAGSPNAGARFGAGWMNALSDERSKQKIMELEAANRGLIAKIAKSAAGPGGGLAMDYADTMAPKPMMRRLPVPDVAKSRVHDEATAAEYGRQVLAARRVSMLEDMQRQQAAQAQNEIAQQRLADEQRQYEMASAGAGMQPQLSDYRSKMVSDEGAKDAVSYLRPVRPVAYEYRPEHIASGEGDPGPQYGLLAQDLARTPQGASVVERGQDGMLRVQTPQLLMLNTAADAEQQREIDELKRRRRVG